METFSSGPGFSRLIKAVNVDKTVLVHLELVF